MINETWKAINEIRSIYLYEVGRYGDATAYV